MEASTKTEYQKILENNQLDVRKLVQAGYEQAQQGLIKDFNSVCDRLEKKYSNEQL